MLGERRRRRPASAGRRLEEAGHRCMSLAPAAARNRRVRNFANDDVLERELLVPFDPGSRLPADQVSRLE